MPEVTIAYIGGGSMEFAWKLISDLSSESELSGVVRLYDRVKQMSIANEAIANHMAEDRECRSSLIYIATETLDETLRDADFVIISISGGSFEERLCDIRLPEMYGVYQSSGDFTGPAGIIRSMRMLPDFIEIAEKIRSLCPNAWVLSLSTPMAPALAVMRGVFPDIKAFGCPSNLYDCEELLAELASREYGRQIGRREIQHGLTGINGFSFMTDVSYNGEDITRIFEAYARKYSDSGFECRGRDYRTNLFSSANRVKFDLFLRYGRIPAVPDRIAADFCPPWYLKSPKVAASWRFNLTTVGFLKKRRAEKLSRQKRLISGAERLKIGGRTNDCVAAIKALSGLQNIISPINSENGGRIENLPREAIVETMALISKNSVRPLSAGAVPDDLLPLITRHIYNHATLVRAVKERDLDIAFNAFVNDPLLTLDLTSATELFREMLLSSGESLSYFAE